MLDWCLQLTYDTNSGHRIRPLLMDNWVENFDVKENLNRILPRMNETGVQLAPE